MQYHRFLGQLDNSSASPVAVGVSSAPSVGGFVLCPPACLPVGWAGQAMMWQVYQLAYQQAQAVVRPSRLERLETATLN